MGFMLVRPIAARKGSPWLTKMTDTNILPVADKTLRGTANKTRKTYAKHVPFI